MFDTQAGQLRQRAALRTAHVFQQRAGRAGDAGQPHRGQEHQRAAERRTLKGKPLTTIAKQTPPIRRQGENGFKYKPQFGLVVPCKDEAEQQRWLEHRREVFTPAFLQAYADELQMLYQQYADDKEKLAQLKALWQYAQEIV